MCGICGIIKFDNSAPEMEKIQMMMGVMKHRGPDDEGIFIEDNIGLGFVRLSILDLSPLGHQPMFSHQPSSNRYVIVYNGEVYNYIELREELRAKGYTFRSNTDTEVVLNSYIEWGEDCLNKFNGMWAFAIYDRQSKEIFCARDRYGIKPFYYYKDDEQLIFASEIPPILSVLNKKPTANNQAIFDYLVFNRTDQTEQTFFNEIKKLQHGCTLRIKIKEKSKKFEIGKWYDLRESVKAAEGFRNADEFREIFSTSVGLRLRSDVPVGVCLSGGLDSSSIVSILLKDYEKKDLNTFSAVYGEGKRGDESEFIRAYSPAGTSAKEGSNTIDSMHFTTPDANSLFNDLDHFISAHAEPIPSTSPYAQFKVMELAKENVIVTLDGQGADESLAGYHYFFGFYFKDLLKQFRLFKLLAEAGYYIGNHNSLYGLKTFAYFLLPEFLKTKARVREKDYLNPGFTKAYSANNTIAGELYNSKSLNEALHDHFEYKLEHLLKWEDRNSMHFSLEARVPFLDYRLVEKTLASPSDTKIKDGMTKHILREAMKGILPEKIRMRKDKIGFMTPEDEWFRTDNFINLVTEILSSVSFNQRNLIDAEKAKQLFNRHKTGEIQMSKEIWKWINLELWFRKFIDN